MQKDSSLEGQHKYKILPQYVNIYNTEIMHTQNYVNDKTGPYINSQFYFLYVLLRARNMN